MAQDQKLWRKPIGTPGVRYVTPSGVLKIIGVRVATIMSAFQAFKLGKISENIQELIDNHVSLSGF